MAVQKAMADSLALLNEKAPNDQVLKLKALEAMQKVADGKATKIIIPSELQGFAGLASGIAETVKQDNQKRKENFLAQFLNAPCVTKCLEHLTPPQPFLLLPRSSLSRIRGTQKPSQSASW